PMIAAILVHPSRSRRAIATTSRLASRERCRFSGPDGLPNRVGRLRLASHPRRGWFARIMHARSKSMLPRIRVALALSAGLAMALLLSSRASAQIVGPGAAWVTIDDEGAGASPTITFGSHTFGTQGTGLYDASSSSTSSSSTSAGTFQGEYY